MSVNSPSDDFNNQIPIFEPVPETWEDAKDAITERFRKVADAVNIRPVGWVLDTPVVTGGKYIPNRPDPKFREISRLSVEIGPLPNDTTKNVPHNLPLVDANFLLVSMLGAATNSTTFVSIPLSFQEGGNPRISMDATNIIVTTTTDFSDFDHGVVILEYTYKE